MSFSVKAGSSPPLPPQQRSPAMHPYVSPHLLPQSTQNASLPSGNGEEHGSSKRVGTDPTKYKTSICRNWVQSGSCSFRGCTFAHGVEELRAPTRPEHHSALQPHASSGRTPPLVPASNNASGAGSMKIEQLLELLGGEVAHVRELASVHMEANRTLEGMLRREQALHEETRAQLEEKMQQYNELVELISKGNFQLQQQSSADGGVSSAKVKEFLSRVEKITPAGNTDAVLAAMLGPAQPFMASASSNGQLDDGPKADDDVRIQEILRVLQQDGA